MTTIIALKGKTGRELAKLLPESDVVIRWGSTKNKDIESLNSREAIMTAADKALCREILEDEGIPVPTIVNLEESHVWPIVGRPRKHSKGKGFYYCENLADVEYAISQGAVYFSVFYPKQNEYRIHIADGRVILFSVKEGDKSKKIWNADNGFTFRHMRRSEWLNNPNLMRIQRKAKKAIAAIGLDFGALDIMADAPSPHAPFVISEINTAPALSPLALTKYANFFTTKIGERNTQNALLERLESAANSVRTL